MHKFGQIKVLAEFESSIFDEVYEVFENLGFTNYTVLFSPCLSQCIDANISKYKTRLTVQRVKSIKSLLATYTMLFAEMKIWHIEN